MLLYPSSYTRRTVIISVATVIAIAIFLGIAFVLGFLGTIAHIIALAQTSIVQAVRELF